MNEIINHTKGEWKSIICAGDVDEIVSIVDGKKEIVMMPEGYGIYISEADLHLVLRSQEVPHSCDDPKCPGNINRQKLEMFDEMASFIENECIDFDVCSYDDCKTCRAHGSCSTEIAMNILSRARALQEAVK